MLADLDMNSNRIINTADPVLATDVVNLRTLENTVGGSGLAEDAPADDLFYERQNRGWVEAPVQPTPRNGAYEIIIPDNTAAGDAVDPDTGIPVGYKDNVLVLKNLSGYPATNEPFDERTRNIGSAAIVYWDVNDNEQAAFGLSGPIVGNAEDRPGWAAGFQPNWTYWMSSDISGGDQLYGCPRIVIGVDITAGAQLRDHLGDIIPHWFGPEAVGPGVFKVFEHDPQAGLTTLRARGPFGNQGNIHFEGSNLLFSQPGTLPGDPDIEDNPQPVRRIALGMDTTRAWLGETSLANQFGIYTNLDDGASAPVNDGFSAWRWLVGGGLDVETVQRMAPDGTGGWRALRILEADGKSSHRLLGLNITGSAKTAGIAQLVAGTVTIATTAAKSGCMPLVTRRGKGGTAFGTMNVTIVDDTSITITSIRANGDTETNDTSAVSWAIINQTNMG